MVPHEVCNGGLFGEHRGGALWFEVHGLVRASNMAIPSAPLRPLADATDVGGGNERPDSPSRGPGQALKCAFGRCGRRRKTRAGDYVVEHGDDLIGQFPHEHDAVNFATLRNDGVKQWEKNHERFRR